LYHHSTSKRKNISILGRAVDPDYLNPDPDPDPDPAFGESGSGSNPDPDPDPDPGF